MYIIYNKRFSLDKRLYCLICHGRLPNFLFFSGTIDVGEMVEIVGNLYELDGTSKVFQRAISHANSDSYRSSAHAQIRKLKLMLMLKLVLLVLIQIKTVADPDFEGTTHPYN